MSTYVIGIGGTGSKIMESLIHISAAGLVNEKENIKMFFVDADIANGNLARTSQIKDLYTAVQKIDGVNLHQTKIDYISDSRGEEQRSWTILNKDINTLKDLFAYDFNRETTASNLFEVLYSGAELDEPLEKGFKGHPNIGSLVIAKTLDVNQKPWKDMVEEIDKENSEVKIVICGSIFGGTGAAGIPTISKILYDKFRENKNVSLNGILMLPYFGFKNTEYLGLKASSEKFLENARYALEYYKNEAYYEYYQNLYIVGDETLYECPVSALGGKEQTNPSFLPELVAALAIKDITYRNCAETNKNVISYVGESEDILKSLPLSGEEKNKLLHYIIFSLHYVNLYYPLLDKFVKDGGIPRFEAWGKNFFDNRNINIHDTANYEALTTFNQYSENFLRWINDMFSVKEFSGYINTTLFSNNGNKIKHMNDITYLTNPVLPKSIKYDAIYKSMNNGKLIKDAKSELGTFFNILYDECSITGGK